MNKVHLIDCMEYMAGLPDNAFELAIVDPPYGIGIGEQAPTKNDRKNGRNSFNKTEKEQKTWDSIIPDEKYFNELFRISKNQIIWGGNYFILPPTRGIICWDKEQYMPSFSKWEMAWTSFNIPASIFRFNNGTGNKIHPTQKPVALYKWLLKNYAKPGDKIFDSHVGSGSIRIACHDLGFEFTGCEIDEDYYKAQEQRFKNHIAQADLFGSDEIQKLVYDS